MLTPILGKLGDAHGKKKLLVISLAIFGLRVASARRWRRTSGADRVPRAAGRRARRSSRWLRDHPRRVPARTRSGVAIGTVSSVFGIGGGVGLVLSGVIVEHLSWHVAVPDRRAAGADLDGADRAFVPESPIKTPAKPDYAGAAALSVGFAALLLALSEGTNWGWTSPGVLGAGRAVVRRARGVGRDRAPRRGPAGGPADADPPGMAATNASDGPARLLDDRVLRARPRLPAVRRFGFAPQPDRGGPAAAPVLAGDDRRRARPRARSARAAAACCRCGSASSLGAVSLAGLAAAARRPAGCSRVWLPIMGAGMAFALAAIGALVIDHSRPEETGVTSGMNTIMRTSGAAIGAQIAAALVSAHPGTGDGYTLAFAMGALALLAALVPTLLLGRERRSAAEPAFA